ncbi:MAG: hypothetical protein CM15mP86_03840 [Gammaproteobacteria bacterium]|nr:MAG: hypothetical protein CM15mP86_03840 [Gammaproteobacteria bacterium]
MLSYIKLRYSFFSFLGLLAFVSLEAPVLASYTQQNEEYFKNEIDYLWKEDRPGLVLFKKELMKDYQNIKKHLRNLQRVLIYIGP